MKGMFRLILAAFLASASFLALSAMDVAALLEKHRAALASDLDALGRVDRLQMTGTVSKYNLKGDVTFMSAGADRFAVEHKFGEWREKAVLTGKTGEVLNLMGWVRPLQSDELAEYQAIRYVLSLQYLKDLDRPGARLQEGPDALTVQVTLEEGIRLDIRFSPATFLIQSFAFTDADGAPRTILLEEYREAKGVKFPAKVRDQAANPAEYTIQEIQVGGGGDAFFALPTENRGFSPSEKKPYRLTLKKYFGFPLVSAWIGNSPALTFLVDLGLPFSVIDRTIAGQLGLMSEGTLVKAVKYPINEFGFVEVPMFQFREQGNVAEFKNRIFLTTDMIPTCANVQLAIHGILGCDFFRQNCVALDLNGDNLRILHPKDFALEKQGTPIPLTNQHGVYEIPFTIDDVNTSLEFTTSSDTCILLSEKCPGAETLSRKAAGRVEALSLGLYYGIPEWIFLAQSVRCGEIPALPCYVHVLRYPENHPLANHRSGWAGCGLWKRFTCYLDFPRSEVTLVPNDRLKEPDCFNSTGVYVIKSGGRIVVQQVIPGTPAEKAGLQPGDIVTEILANPADAFVFERIYYNFCKPKGEKIPMKIQRGEEALPVEITTEAPL
ncbi:MAG: PDZ domain-containing protein [Acidobacteria bacterium]|nr:PDZ domain-containing protein [Acidobacteriota bacterium]